MDVKLISQLREQTGAGMLAVKKALDEASGDIEKAIEILRKTGAMKAAKKADRVTGQGSVGSYIHGNGSVGAMVEVQCETDFVSRNEQFQELVHDIAMHVAAMNPLYITREEVPVEIIDKEKDIYREEVKDKPVDVVEKILEGKVNKYYKDVCLMEQEFVKDDTLTIEGLIQNKVLQLGENIKIARFTRFQLGQ